MHAEQQQRLQSYHGHQAHARSEAAARHDGTSCI